MRAASVGATKPGRCVGELANQHPVKAAILIDPRGLSNNGRVEGSSLRADEFGRYSWGNPPNHLYGHIGSYLLHNSSKHKPTPR